MINAKFSPLRLNHFELIQSDFRFIPPIEAGIKPNELFDQYKVEIDFIHNETEDKSIRLFVKVAVNYIEKPESGYSLLSEGIGVFSLPDQIDLDPNHLNNIKYFSTLNMMINNLRNIMFQTSNLGPIGGYLLPPIDILDLFSQKNDQSNKVSGSE